MAKKASNASLSRELKGLGQDLSKAVKTMLRSEEFKHLEKEIATGIKSIGKSLGDSLKAARKSKSASRIRKRLRRVVKEGSKQGKVKAKRAQETAARGLRKARESVRKMSKK